MNRPYKVLVNLFIFCLFIACSGNDVTERAVPQNTGNPYSISGRVSDLPGPKVLLYELYQDQVNLLDSVMADGNGNFEITMEPGMSHGLYRIAMGKSTAPGQYDGHRQQFDLIWDGTPVKFYTNYAAPVDSMKIVYSEENTLYYRYLKRMNLYDHKVGALSSALVNYPPQDNFYRRLQRQYRRVQNHRANYTDNIVKKNSETIFASIARFMKLPRMLPPGDENSLEEVKKSYFFEGQFADPVLLHTDLIPRRVMRYLSLYTGGNPGDDEQQEKLIIASDVIMEHAMENEDIFYFVLEYLINGFESMDMDLVTEHLNNRYLLGNVCFETGRLLDQDSFEAVEDMKEGDPVPDFSFQTADGMTIGLSDIEAQHTLLLFWGSWCHHCEDVMDDLYELYAGYKSSNDGFLEVIAIGIEDNEQEWHDHIEQGGFDWINYSSFQRWDCPIASQYQLIGTPTMILLDRDKRFISEPTRIRALGRTLSGRGG